MRLLGRGSRWCWLLYNLHPPAKSLYAADAARYRIRSLGFLPFGLSWPSFIRQRRPHSRTTLSQAHRSVPASGFLAFASLFLLFLPSCQLDANIEKSLNSNSSSWDTDYKELFQKIVQEASESQKHMIPFHKDLPLNRQNLTTNVGERQDACDQLLRFSQYVLVKAFGRSLAFDVVEHLNCIHPNEVPQIRLNPAKVLHSQVQLSFFYDLCQLLEDVGAVVEMDQPKPTSRLRNQIVEMKKTEAKSEKPQNDNCYFPVAHLVPWHPGHNTSHDAIIGRGEAFCLESSATFHSLRIQEGGILVFADNPEQPIILRAGNILLENGGALYIGSEHCPYRSRATISLYGKATEGTGVADYGKKFLGVGKGGVLEFHGRKPRSWTFLAKTLYPGGLQHGLYTSEKQWSSRGLNVRIIDAGTARVVASGRFDTHLLVDESRRLIGFLARQPTGHLVAMAVGDSAAKSLTVEARLFLKDLLHSQFILHLKYRQPWALLGVLGGDGSSTIEDIEQPPADGASKLAIATNNFETYEGVSFSITAYSGWNKGVPHHGFKVEVPNGLILDLVDDVTSWLPGDEVVVASTDYSMHQAEEFRLLFCPECQKHQVKIDGTPLYLHMGEIVDGVDMRAEVGLLTRNILIQGEVEESCYGENHCQFFSFDTFGGQIKIQRNFTSVHMAGVELKHMGQQIMGSYPVHFHLTGDVDQRGGYDPPSYLDNLAIHHCFSRCVAIHGAHGLLVKDTIGYDTLGHCFFLEDGIEQRNTFQHNLALVTKAGTILPTDRNEAMCLAMRDHVYGDYVPVPSKDCMAVSSFWIAHPNNNLIDNSAAGAQHVGIWYIFHHVPTGQSEGQYPAGQSELTPLGTFRNNRVHSNFKAGLFIGKGVKTTKASIENPREYLTVDNGRFRPHEDADPGKPRVPALIEGLVAFKNNDHGAWARGGEIVFRNCGFADNGIGLTLASDGTFPIDDGCSLEVTHSVFVGESNNVGSHGGQNSYWGKGANGEYRTLPRNKTFPIRGFQVYDGPIRLTKCTFRKFAPTIARHSSAIGFFMKNAWQVSPQNNVSLVRMEESVGLKVFLGTPGQWFGGNNNDGDKVSVFHDLDGSVTGYPDTFVGRADNYLIRHRGCLAVPRWNGVICTGKYAQLYIQARRPENLTLSVARTAYRSRPLRLRGVNRGVSYQQYQPVVMLEQAYLIQWDHRAPEDITLYPINFNRGDWIQVALCYPKGTAFTVLRDIYHQQTGKAHSVKPYMAASSLYRVLKHPNEGFFYFNNASGYLFVHLRAREARTAHSYCSARGCERLKITAIMPSGGPWSCPPNPFAGVGAGRINLQPSGLQRRESPCRQCGTPWVAITSTPSIGYVRIQIQSLKRADVQDSSRVAFVKVNDEVFLCHPWGIFLLVLDACSGTVVSQQHFDTTRPGNIARAVSAYVETSVKDRSVVLVCTKGLGEEMPTYEMSAFTKLGSTKSVTLHKTGSLAMLGYKGNAKPSWIKIHSQTADQKSASLHYYIPLMLGEYGCPVDGTKV